jgi:hypothetical protein
MGTRLNKEARRYKDRHVNIYCYRSPCQASYCQQRIRVSRFPWSGEARRPVRHVCFYVARNEIKSTEPNITPLQSKHSLDEG